MAKAKLDTEEKAKAPGSQRLAAEQLKRYNELKSERDSQFMTTWQTLSQYFLPQDSNINVEKTEGTVDSWTQNIYDTTAIQCAETLRSGQYNWLTPPNQRWAEFGLPAEVKSSPDEDEDAEDDATQWLDKNSDTARDELARSNFYPTVAEAYLGVGVFATDMMILEEGTRANLLNFIHCKIGTYVIEENDEGIVDTLRREFTLTYRQACQKFNKPGDLLPDEMERESKDQANGSKKYKFLHCIFPREDSERMPGAKTGPNKPIASVYISMDFKECVRVAGYDENPILGQRFDKWGDTPWGYGPAYLSLPDARQLNYVQQYLDALAELLVVPRVLVPDNLDGDVDLRAGGVTTWDGNKDSKPQEWATAGDYKLGMELQEQKREQMRDAFYVQAFKLLNSQPLIDRKDMTAYEISQRQAEQLSSFTPAFGRRITEFLNPLMLRVFGILYRAGKFGQAPDSLMKDLGEGKRGLTLPNVVITSRISDALKALKNRGTEETVQFVIPLIEARPEILDVFDLDKLVKDYARNTGMPADSIRSSKELKTIRAARAKAQAQQQAIAMAEQASSAAANLGKAPEFLQKQVQEREAA